MAGRFEWTPERNALLLAMRARGEKWDTISCAVGVNRNAVIDHTRGLGVRKRFGQVGTIGLQPIAAAPRVSVDRSAYAAGHPETWGLITRGTSLDCGQYPWPVWVR